MRSSPSSRSSSTQSISKQNKNPMPQFTVQTGMGFFCYLVPDASIDAVYTLRAVRRICRTYTIRSAAPVKIHEAG